MDANVRKSSNFSLPVRGYRGDWAVILDAHPGLYALNRYLSQDDKAEIDLEPKLDPNEVLDTLHLFAFSLLTVLVAVDQMLGHEASGLLMKLTQEFQELERGLRSKKPNRVFP
ncbi:hypothetical protein ACQPTN_20815 [Bradyrhizobium sp. 13971]